jgi:NADP-dependent 3-hydroxy acid dehydrogenase YdfG
MTTNISKATSGRPGFLQGKVAVVTGAARGLGRATAIAFARGGADPEDAASY